jgi:hypothetical protein
MGRVFKGSDGNEIYDELYVVDGSIIPTPLGVNPSLTIAVLSFRIALNIIEDKHFLPNLTLFSVTLSCRYYLDLSCVNPNGGVYMYQIKDNTLSNLLYAKWYLEKGYTGRTAATRCKC